MNLMRLLEEHGEEVIAKSMAAIGRAHLKHYEEVGSEDTRLRLRALFQLIAKCVKERNLAPIVTYANEVAEERHRSGFDLYEVQTAFNVLEEAIWHLILERLEPADFAEALGLVSTVLGAGKDALARSYVSLASKTKAPSLDLQGLFKGAGGS